MCEAAQDGVELWAKVCRYNTFQRDPISLLKHTDAMVRLVRPPCAVASEWNKYGHMTPA
jgi:hypothetical protein